jgi:hypothetical protein
MATVSVPESLSRLFAGMPRQLDAGGSTALALIEDVDRRYPGFRDRLCESNSRQRRHVLLFVDGAIAGLEAEVGPGSELLIVPALSGG